jgi:hypothetical protein
MKLASSEARKRIAFAISSGCAILFKIRTLDHILSASFHP